MEQSIKSEIDSIDKEIEALQKRKSQLQSSAVGDTKSLDLDELIESANAQLVAKLGNDYLKFATSKEGIVSEDELFDICFCDSNGRKIIKRVVRFSYASNWIERVISNAKSIYSIVLEYAESIVYDSSYKESIVISTPKENLMARLNLSNEAGRFDISVETRLLNEDDEVIITHEKHPSVSIKVRGGIRFATFNYLRESVEYEDVYSALNDADDAYDSFTVSTY